MSKGAAVVVDGAPDEFGVIDEAEVRRAIALAAAADNRARIPAAGSQAYEDLEQAALEELIDGAWIRGQAAEMGLEVTPAERNAELARIKRRNFQTEAAYGRFLRDSRLSAQEIDQRVELQLLSTQIQTHVKGGEEAFADFVSQYQSRWRERTFCAPDFRFERCSNGPRP